MLDFEVYKAEELNTLVEKAEEYLFRPLQDTPYETNLALLNVTDLFFKLEHMTACISYFQAYQELIYDKDKTAYAELEEKSQPILSWRQEIERALLQKINTKER